MYINNGGSEGFLAYARLQETDSAVNATITLSNIRIQDVVISNLLDVKNCLGLKERNC